MLNTANACPQSPQPLIEITMSSISIPIVKFLLNRPRITVKTSNNFVVHALAAMLALGTAISAHAADPKTTYICVMSTHHHMAGHPATEYDKPGICPTDGMEMIAKNSRLNVAVLVFNGVQDIDYSGPMEVFGQANANIYTVAANTDNVRSVFGINMRPDFDIEHAPAPDVLLVPGGDVTSVIKNPKMMEWLRQTSATARSTLSVCTGAFILGKAGLLDGIQATTNAGYIEQLGKVFPKAHMVTDRRYVDSGKIITSGGLSAGIDGALHVVDRELGRLRASDVARGMEYEWRPDGNGSFASLAGYQIPDLATFLPAGASWERTYDDGDRHHWETRGRLEITESAQEFLEHDVGKIATQEWKAIAATDKLSRRFVKTRNDQTWQLTISLINESQANAYQLTAMIKELPKAQTKSSKRTKA
jgi:putative intracellular protease/amidase